MSNFEEDFHWYAINTKPNQEQKVSLILLSGGIETFAPKIKSFRSNSFTGKKTYFRKSLFPNYIFARFKLARDFNKVRFTRGIHSIIGFGGSPNVVDDDIIDLIQNRTDQDGVIDLDNVFNPGDRVTVNKPYLKDFIGVFVKELSDHARVQILLSTVNYQLNLIVDKDYVSKL